MMKFVLMFFLSVVSLFPQAKQIIGTVTYYSSQNFYVRFEDASQLAIGDTLWVSSSTTAAGIIKFLSSQSAACSYIGRDSIPVQTSVYVLSKRTTPSNTTTGSQIGETGVRKDLHPKGTNETLEENLFDISGRISLRSFTNYSSYSPHTQNQYWRYGLSLRSQRVGMKNLEFQSSATYGYRADALKNSGSIWNNLKVYDFFFSFKPEPSLVIQAGRIRNQNLYSLATFDGLLMNYSFSHFSAGAFFGSHPDWQTMGLNIKLLEFGAFVSREDQINGVFLFNNLSFANQTNTGKTDRRYIYFLNRTRTKDFALSFSSEVDLYQVESGIPKSIFKPTSIFASALYRFDRKLSVDLSYDARKTVYYFETFKSSIDSILDARMRQGLRLGAYYQLLRTLSISLNGGFATQTNDLHPSFHGGTSVTVNELTTLDFSLTGDFTYLQSNYLNGFAYGLRVAKSFNEYNLDAGLALRRVDYLFVRNTSDGVAQNIIDADVNWFAFNNLSLSLMYEFVSEKRFSSHRLFIGVSRAF